MENTINALIAGVNSKMFYDVLTQYVPYILAVIPIAVGYNLIVGVINHLQQGCVTENAPFGIGDPMSIEYANGLKKGYWRNTDEYLNG